MTTAVLALAGPFGEDRREDVIPDVIRATVMRLQLYRAGHEIKGSESMVFISCLRLYDIVSSNLHFRAQAAQIRTSGILYGIAKGLSGGKGPGSAPSSSRRVRRSRRG